MRAAKFFMVRRTRRSAIPWRGVQRVGKANTQARLAGVAGAAALVAWAVVQYEGRRPRPPEAEVDVPLPDGIEIERKFLVRELPANLESCASEEIEQGYLAIDGDVELRVRRSDGNRTVLTLKAGGGESRLEEEFEIDPSRFGALWPLTKGRRLRKVRHRIPAADGLTFELDVYDGFLKGLNVVEIEFPSEQASAAFRPPAWVGKEVTGDPAYKNQTLAQREALARADRVFRLRIDETVPVGIKRMAAGQIEEILERLDGRTDEELGTAVHESRKSLKRLRALVRLVRAELGDEVYRRENETFREVGRALSGARDSQVLIDALDALVERYPRELGAASLTSFRSQLVSAVETPRLAELAHDVRVVESRIADWPIERRGIKAAAPGLERAYRRGRRAYRGAAREPSAENLHEWRKRVKDLWYSAQVLEEADPKRMRKLGKTAHELSELLGDDHDLVVLEERAEAAGSDFPDTASPMLLRVMAQRRRAELQGSAFRIGSRLYRESPDKFVKRVERGWRKRGGIR